MTAIFTLYHDTTTINVQTYPICHVLYQESIHKCTSYITSVSASSTTWKIVAWISLWRCVPALIGIPNNVCNGTCTWHNQRRVYWILIMPEIIAVTSHDMTNASFWDCSPVRMHHVDFWFLNLHFIINLACICCSSCLHRSTFFRSGLSPCSTICLILQFLCSTGCWIIRSGLYVTFIMFTLVPARWLADIFWRC